MALNIRNAETERLAKTLARRTGETKTEAVTKTLRERSRRLDRDRSGRQLDEIASRCASLPVLDRRSDDGIIGYDARGLPG